MKLMLTCEHASNKLPAAFKKFVPTDVQKTHRAYDIGALQVFRKLVKFAKPEFSCEGKFSRLFVDLNRTITNKSAFSEYYGKLEASDMAAAKKMKASAIAYWMEYRELAVAVFALFAIFELSRTETKEESKPQKIDPTV